MPRKQQPDDGTILVAAPRKTRFEPLDPQSRIVFRETDLRHPANEAYASLAGEVCICEGEGVDGDQGRANNPRGNPPWCVFPTPEVAGHIRLGTLVEVEPGEDTSDLALSEDDLGSLQALDERQVGAIKARGIETVPQLADKIAASEDPVKFLTGFKGIGKAAALHLLNELLAHGLIQSAPTE